MKWTRKNEPTSETEMERTLTANDVNECSNQQTTSTGIFSIRSHLQWQARCSDLFNARKLYKRSENKHTLQ